MTIMEMLGQSGVLAVLGMGVVFSFLVIMIIAVTLTGKVIHALGWDKDVRPGNTTGKPSGDAAVTAAIGAAVNEYRKNN